MTEREYHHYTSRGVRYLSYIKERQEGKVVQVDLKDNVYSVIVEELNSGERHAIDVNTSEYPIGSEVSSALALISQISIDMQSSVGITFSYDVKIIERYRRMQEIWVFHDTEYLNLKISTGSLSEVESWFRDTKTSTHVDYPTILSVSPVGHGGQVHYQEPNNHRSGHIRLGADNVSKRLRDLVDYLIDNSYSYNYGSHNYKIKRTVKTQHVNPKEIVTVFWDVDIQTEKNIKTDIKRSHNALGAMTRTERTSALMSLLDFPSGDTRLGFSSANPRFYMDFYPILRSDTGSWIKGDVVRIIDGDTIVIKASDSFNAFQSISGGSSIPVENGKEYTIRLVGIDTAEIRKNDPKLHNDAEERNIEWLAENHLVNDPQRKNLEMAFDIGEDAATFVDELISGKEVIIDLETVDHGYGQGNDSYHRLLGVIHLPLDLNSANDSINVNRSLLKSTSKRHPDFSLANVSYILRQGVLDSKFPVIGWMSDSPSWVSPERPEDDEGLIELFDGFKNGSQFIDTMGNVWYNNKDGGAPLSTEQIKILNAGELRDEKGNTYRTGNQYRSNLNPLIDEDDDELEWDPYEDMPTNFHVRIGDVVLVVPPLSIQVVNISKNEKVNTLRNKHAIQVQSGYSDYIITMDLFFHDVDAINGVEIPNPFEGTNADEVLKELWPEPYYVNGLRALLAQFKKAPFIPIYNEFLEKTYEIQSVGLEGIQINTVPGFPNTLSVSLTLVNFDHSAYMPDTVDFGDVINWPIFRWYVQDALQPRYIEREAIDLRGMTKKEEVLDPGHTYIGKIPERFNSDISFEIASRDILESRTNAIKSLRGMHSPAAFRRKNESIDTTIGKFQNDYEVTEAALRQLRGFNRWKHEHPADEYPFFYDDNGVFDGYANGEFNIFNHNTKLDTLKGEYPEIFNLMAYVYGDNWGDDSSPDPQRTQLHSYRNKYFLMNSCPDLETRTNIPEKPLARNPHGGWIIVPIMAEINQNLVKSKSVWYFEVENRDDKIVVCAISPADTTLLQILNRNGKEGGKGAIDAYTDQAIRTERIADISEDTIPMEPVYIPDLHISSISGHMYNIFTKLQIQELESPSLQYLGSQEAYFTIKAQTKSKETVRQLKNLVQNAHSLARDYRMAINSGFLNINNDIINFVGVRSILVEQIAVSTVPGTPELIDIEMHCTSFDKTQRDRESINQIQLRDPSTSEYTLKQFQDYFESQSNNEQQQWVIFDYKLRQQELYPDLDLPTWVEFRKAIPYLRCGFKSIEELDRRIERISGELPPDRGKYVDPDFYVHCDWTNRYLAYEALEDDEVKALMLRDLNGARSVDYVPVSIDQALVKPNIEVNQKFWIEDEHLRKQVQEDLLEYQDVLLERGIDVTIQSADTGYYTKYDREAIQEQTYDKPESNMDEVRKYRFIASRAEDRDKFVFEYMHTLPTADELIRWRTEGSLPSDTNTYTNMRNQIHAQLKDPFSLFKNPSNAEVISAIEDYVDRFFTFHQDDMEDSYQDFIYGGGGIISKPRITRRKVINVLKGIVHVESSFRQFYNGPITIGDDQYDQPMPLFPLNNYGELWETKDGWIAVGLMQMAVGSAGYARNLDEARRMAWDWRYNLKVGIARFAEAYHNSMHSKDPEGSALPLDYAIIKYNTPQNKNLTCSYYQKFRSIFDNNYARADQVFADTLSTRNERLAKSTNLDHLKSYAIRNPRAAYVDERFHDLDSKISWSLYPNVKPLWDKHSRKGAIDDEMVINTFSFYDPSDYPDREVNSAHTRGTVLNTPDIVGYSSHKRQSVLNALEEHLKNGGSFDIEKDVVYIEMVREDGRTYLRSEVILGGENLSQPINDRLVREELLHSHFLPDHLTAPSEALYRSFNDSIEFDMRGRLTRAFPTFQMFIVDEGRWMLWYKLWDNLYGYNAIRSIDLIKDREIVADTLIMEMTNVYSNLSTKYSRYREDNSSFKITDIFSGSPTDAKRTWNTIFNIADQDVIDAQSEHLDTMMLKAGARIHLRLGYGSNASNLPIVFNGTITEMDSQEITTIIAQGDGIELTNKLNVKPGETNASFFNLVISEPRELICGLMSSKGSIWRDLANRITKGFSFKHNPLGIAHFGNDAIVPPALGNLPWFRTSSGDYGEVGLNIYSASGHQTFSQWVCYGKIDKIKEPHRTLSWGKEVTPEHIAYEGQRVKEPRIKIFLYDKTIWDIVNLLSMAVPDYVCAVHPFELRSTIFYGKPMWGLAYRYDYLFRVNPESRELQRIITHEFRKPYSQFHTFNGFSDIIANKVKATESGVYTNVIVAYGGNDEKTTPMVHADTDIFTEKQKTAIVRADIALDKRIHFGGIFSTNFWTSEAYAQTVGANALKNYMSYMYDGELVLLGYPSVKPHDRFYLEDNYSDMQGVAGVRRVVHHMSFETGFTTSVTPDCVCVVDDMHQLSLAHWQSAVAGVIVGRLLVRKAARSALDRIFGALVGRAWRRNPAELGRAIGGIVGRLLGDPTSAQAVRLTDDIMDALRSGRKLTNLKSSIVNSKSSARVIRGIQRFFSGIDTATDAGKAWRKAGKTAKLMRTLKGAAVAADIALGLTGMILVEVGITVLTRSIPEMYRRWRNRRQAVVIMPLKYRGRPYTAGVNGHKGLVYGEPSGRWDKWFEDNWVVQIIDGLLFDEDKNPSLRRKARDPQEFLRN